MEEFNLFDMLDQLDGEEEEESVLPAAATPPVPAAPEPEPEEEEPETTDAVEPEMDEDTEEEEEEESGQGALFPDPKPAPAKKSAAKKEPKKAYTGPRRILAYGQELWIENDPTVTLEAIRQRIVTDYQYGEFSKDRTFMSLDEETGIVVPVIQFQKKG